MGQLLITRRKAMSNTSIEVVALTGTLDGNSSDDLTSFLENLFLLKKYKVILDLERLTFMTSDGISVLVSQLKNFRRNGGDLKLSGMTHEIFHVFELMELTNIFKVYKTEREAASDFLSTYSAIEK